MPSPFPGMNPYLENPRLWSEVHSRLIVNLADAIVTDLPDRYRVAVEQRTYLDSSDGVFVGMPDVSVFAGNADRNNAATATLAATSDCVTVSLPMPEQVTERYLEIQEIATGFVVTALEILSPKNKRSGEGRTAYLSFANMPSSPSPFSQVWEKGSKIFKVPLPSLGEGFRVRATKVRCTRGERRISASENKCWQVKLI